MSIDLTERVFIIAKVTVSLQKGILCYCERDYLGGKLDFCQDKFTGNSLPIEVGGFERQDKMHKVRFVQK